MKNIYVLTLAIFALLVISGCDEFLDEDPRGLLTPENFFLNEEEANIALNGLASRMNNNDISGQNIVRHTTLGTDEGVAGRSVIAGGLVFFIYFNMMLIMGGMQVCGISCMVVFVMLTSLLELWRILL